MSCFITTDQTKIDIKVNLIDKPKPRSCDLDKYRYELMQLNDARKSLQHYSVIIVFLTILNDNMVIHEEMLLDIYNKIAKIRSSVGI